MINSPLRHLSLIALILGLLLLFSCRRDDDFFNGNDASLVFSSPKVSFDTVFTTIGSVTKNIRVFNPYKERLKINNIRLNTGALSSFRINVDGQAGASFQNIEIAPKDSIFIFIEVTVDPNNQSSPFVIEDYIEFNTNGNTQKIDLVAWGQNAHYFTPTTFNRNLPDYSCLTGPNNASGPCSRNIPAVDVTWTDDLPYVIYGYVVVDSADVLTIEEGVDVYFHNNGGLWVFQGGTLKVRGTKDNPVTFQGGRLEEQYRKLPGQWDRIWINEGGNNEINYAIIKNAFIGLQVEVLPFYNPPYNLPSSLTINNTIIENCSNIGLLASIYNIDANNLLIDNCGLYNAALRASGRYNFKHCTFVNYFNEEPRETPAFFVQNAVVNALGTQIIGTPEVNVYNSIIDGNLETEFNIDIVNNGSIDFDIQNTLLKTKLNLSDPNQFQNLILNNTNPIFKNIQEGDYELIQNSIAKDRGLLTIGTQVQFDLNGNDRTLDQKPDLGVYEFIP